MGKNPGEPWTEDDCMDFRSIFLRFKIEFEKKNKNLAATVGDAFLTLVELHGYENIRNISVRELN